MLRVISSNRDIPLSMMATHKRVLHCLAHLPKSFAQRRLNSELTKHVVPVLCEASARRRSVILGVSDRLVCCCCFRDVEKLLRLRKVVEELEDDLPE